MTDTRFELADEAGVWLRLWPDGIIALDERHCVLFVSKAAQTLLGIDRENAVGQAVHTLLCAQTQRGAHTAQHCPLCANAPQSEPISALWRHALGDFINVDYRKLILPANGRAHALISFQDNATRRHNQAELNRFAEYVDQSPAPLGEFTRDGQLVFANVALQALMLDAGFTEQGYSLLLPANVAELCERVCAGESIAQPISVEVGERWLAWHFYPMADKGQQQADGAVVGYGFDITAQQLAENALVRQKAEARRDFFAKMVHELRTPLNAIIGFSQVLMRRSQGLLGEREMANLKAIHSAGLQLNELVSDTLDAAKIDAGKLELQLERFEFDQLLATTSPQLAALAELKRLEFTTRCVCNLSCYTDAKKLRQILVNLVSNAIKYTPQGAVSITVEQAWLDGRVCAVIAVTDTGIGIPGEAMDRLFTNYHRVTEERHQSIQGTGLGLALVAELVRLLEGDIAVQSQPHEGSTFTVRLPCRLAHEQASP